MRKHFLENEYLSAGEVISCRFFSPFPITIDSFVQNAISNIHSEVRRKIWSWFMCSYTTSLQGIYTVTFYKVEDNDSIMMMMIMMMISIHRH